MAEFIVSSDSCCDIPSSETEARHIYRLAMTYTMEKEGKITTHKDNFNTDEEFDEFYNELSGGATAKTSQLTINEHLDYFKDILDRENKDVVHFTLSSGLSGTYDQALIASKMLAEKGYEKKVYVIDSLSATIGQMLLVDEAEKMRDAGMSAAEAVAKLEELKLHVHHWLIVDDLDHLKRGGRISGAAAAMGKLLNLKPFIGINHEGRLVVLAKNKGVKKSVAKVLDVIKKYCADPKNTKIYVFTTNAPENADALKAAIDGHFGVNSEIRRLGAVIGAHTGPGAFAAAFIGKERIRDLS